MELVVRPVRPRLRRWRVRRRAGNLLSRQLNLQLVARCEHFSVLHKPYHSLRMHHELHAKPDFVLCHNIDYSLLGQGLVLAVNNLKKEECVRVIVRCRPLSSKEKADGRQKVVDMDKHRGTVRRAHSAHDKTKGQRAAKIKCRPSSVTELIQFFLVLRF